MIDSVQNRWMDRAAELAWKGVHAVESNPMVGAVLVKNGEIIGEGYHERFGEAHAEINAIKRAKANGKSLEGSVLFVTLEPCNHVGKTAPCTSAIQKAGIQKVYFGMKDPNPKVSGNGATVLAKNGIPTQQIETRKTQALNQIYQINTLQKRPFVHLKMATTSDGRITMRKGQKSQLSGVESMQKVHALRNQYDAILVGINTIKIDNPRLTTRIPDGKNPLRIILDSNLSCPSNAKVLEQIGQTLLVTCSLPPYPEFKGNTQIKYLPCDKNGQVELKSLMSMLFSKGIRSILVEGGAQIGQSFLKAGFVDQMSLIRTSRKSNDENAPKAPNDEMWMKNPEITMHGKDQWIEGVAKNR